MKWRNKSGRLDYIPNTAFQSRQNVLLVAIKSQNAQRHFRRRNNTSEMKTSQKSFTRCVGFSLEDV